MRLLDRLRSKRADLHQRRAQGEKGSIMVWLYIIEITIEFISLWRSK